MATRSDRERRRARRRPSRSSAEPAAEALERLEQARCAAAESGSTSAIPRILLQKGELHLLLEDSSAASEDFALALLAAETTSNRAAAAAALNGLGRVHYRTGSLAVARRSFQSALETAPETMESLRAAVRQNLGVVASATGALDEARLCWIDALARFAALDDAAGLARIHNNLGVSSMARGEWAESESYFRQGLAAAERTGDALITRCLHLNMAARALALGSVDTALAELERVAAGPSDVPPAAAATMPLGFRLLEAPWLPAPLRAAGG